MTTAEKLPPHNIEAEEGLLGAILVDPAQLVVVRAIVEPTDFYREKTRWVYQAMLQAEEPDQITVAHALGARLEEIGGPAYLSELVSKVPSSIFAAHYAKIVADCAILRALITKAGRMAGLAYQGGDPTEVIAKAHQMINEVTPRDRADLIDPKTHAERMLDWITRERKQHETLRFGYTSLDNKTGGMQPTNLIVVGARPGMGKSQIVQEVATFNADRDKVILVASVEMSLAQWDERQVAMETSFKIEQQKVREPNERELMRIHEVVQRTYVRQLYFLEGGLTLANIERQAYYLQETKGLDLLIVDYAQLLADTVDGDSMRAKVGFISRSMKRLARGCYCPVILVSQLNRNVEMRASKAPLLSDLKEAGDLEQDADLILLLWRPEVYSPEDRPGKALVTVAKQRQGGSTGTLELTWSPGASHYYDAEFDMP